MPANFFDLFENPRLMPHMHLPLQSGCDSVLRRMARRCKTADFAALVERARGAVTHFNITTDLIVGFPGESEQEWRRTMQFVADTGFGHVHVFPFSARDGTKAARLDGQIDGETRKARCQEMLALAAELKRRELGRHLGSRAEVLWERRLAGGSGRWIGYTPHYHKICSSRTDLEPARVTEVGVDSISADGSMLVSHAAQARVAIADLRYHAAGS